MDKNWQQTLKEVLYWYFNSNDSKRGIDAGIILTQAAIELLAYEYAVRQKMLIEKNGFQKLKASDKFRIILSSLDIPIHIPFSQKNLTKLAVDMKWVDSPHALTAVRNDIIHPDRKRRIKMSESFFEVWNLGLWLLELAILRICGYEGTYANRLTQRWVGTVENVPWLKQ